MKTQLFLTSACRCCGHYKPEGRRGGMCQQLCVPVQGNWKACSLAAPPFETDVWEHLEEDIASLENSLVLDYSSEVQPLETASSEEVFAQ
ncbi:MAG: hypothetical protein WBG70_12430 [Spirulinaceae cyanobacterium]